MRRFYRLLYFTLILLLLLNGSMGLAAPASQEVDPFNLARSMLAGMTPEERVGQLFLVTFNGVDAAAQTPIYDLIVKYHVGGVMLRADNDNFLEHDETVPFTQVLARQLQNHEYNASQQEQVDATTGEVYKPAYIPLFIGISQEGNGYPYDQILSTGMTQLPSQMALGATWQPDLARQVGYVLGNELSALGINLLLGPSLDVLEYPVRDGGGDMGVRTFGGDPFWVGEMGRAYITGVQQGSGGEMAVIAKHFPGYGSSDRLPEEEVATVRKTLEQLTINELAPFFAVTGNASPDVSAVDGLLTSHIRYQGFQGGNIRDYTKPVSLDPNALSQLISLPQFSTWRDNGGMMVSDDLGSRAIRRFYEFSGQTFTGRYVAREAFQAGNDLLYLGDLSTPETPEAHTAIIRTIEFFNQRYHDDTFFAQRVDESVLRILALKYRIYKGAFNLSGVLPPPEVPSFVGRSSNVTNEVLRQAATLLNPNQAELANTMPEPPGRNDRIVFITDVRTSQQCGRCRVNKIIDEVAMRDTVIRLYSPGAGGEISQRNLAYYTFDDLQEMLDVGRDVVQIENDLRQSKWIVFLIVNEDPGVRSSQALRRFLDLRIDLLQQKKIVVFSLGAPYYLDATDISKLTAYYALYSKTPKSLEIAARLLFQDLRAGGAPPISVPGIGYDLNLAVEPDPAQTIALSVGSPPDPAPPIGNTPTPGPVPQLKVGDMVTIYTGVILDQNGRRVPDNTYVQFFVTHGEANTMYEAQTIQGIATVALRADSPGLIQVRAESERARTSDVLQFEVPPEISPAGEELQPTPTPTETPTLTVTVTPSATPDPEPLDTTPPRDIRFGDWFLSLLITVGTGLSLYWIALSMGQIRWGVRTGFLALIGGMLGYTYLALKLPGSIVLVENQGALGVLTVTFFGAVIGGAAALGWRGVQFLKKG